MTRLLSLLVLPICLFSMGDAVQTSNNIIFQMSGSSTKTTTSDKDIMKHFNATKSRIHYEEVVYAHVLKYENDRTMQVASADKKALEGFSYDVGGAWQKEKDAEILALAESTKDKQEKQEKQEAKARRYAEGYCYLQHDVEINRIATYAYLECDLNAPFNTVTLAVSFVPEFYAKAVIGSLLYVSKDDKRYPIANGVLLTKDRNSINVANYVNDNMTKKILATGTYKGLNSVARQAEAFMAQRRAADTRENTVVTNNGLSSTTQTSTKTRDPNAAEYLVSAAIQLASEISTIVGEAYIKSLPYIFKINKGSVFYVDMQFEKDGDMKGYRIRQNNIVQQEPTIVNGVEQTIKNQAIEILGSQFSTTSQGGE